jgi:hypothetical protein
MASTEGTLVASTTRSLASPAGKCAQLLAPDAQALLATVTEMPFSETSKQAVTVLMSLLFGITENTISGDVLALGTYRAQDICDRMGIDEDLFEEVVADYIRFANQIRNKNPMAF